jgi:hypothetical protein
MTVEDILNEFNKSDLEAEFERCVRVLMREQQNIFLVDYFINTLPKNVFINLRDSSPSEILKTSVNEYDGIINFIEKNKNKICNRLVYALDIEFDGTNEDLFNEVYSDKILINLMDFVYDFLDYREFDIVELLIDMNLIDSKIIEPQKISDLDDSIGDVTILSDRLDYDTRDSAFVDIDGKILIGNKGNSHAQIIQDYLDEFGNKLENEWERPFMDEMDNFSDKYYAFGHILDNNIFIETYTLDNTSINTIISDIKNSEIDYDKIYEYARDEITRVAKVIK